MTKKDYERAAEIAQDVATGAIMKDLVPESFSDVVEAFVALFEADGNPHFDEARFRRACEPGANVRARGSVKARS